MEKCIHFLADINSNMTMLKKKIQRYNTQKFPQKLLYKITNAVKFISLH